MNGTAFGLRWCQHACGCEGENSSGVSVPWYRMPATVLMWKHLLTSVLKWRYKYFCQAATCCQRSYQCFMQALSLESSFVVFSQHNETAESHTGCQNFSAVLFLMSLRFNCIYFLLRVNQGAGLEPRSSFAFDLPSNWKSTLCHQPENQPNSFICKTRWGDNPSTSPLDLEIINTVTAAFSFLFFFFLLFTGFIWTSWFFFFKESWRSSGECGRSDRVFYSKCGNL